MGNKQEPAKSLRFHHGTHHCVNVQSEVRKVLAFALYLLWNRVRWLQKPNDSLSRSVSLLIGILAALHFLVHIASVLLRHPWFHYQKFIIIIFKD